MKSMMKRTTVREIRGSFGRFFAILAIVALGVGFFAGLKVSKASMISTVDAYLDKNNFYDLRLISTLGFEEEDVEVFAAENQVKTAVGAEAFDILCTAEQENEIVLKAHTFSKESNGVRLIAGRIQEKANECLADSQVFSENQIGSTITLTDSNEEDTLNNFSQKEYIIVGIADASYYMNFERGTTSLGNGKVNGYIYLLPEGFDCDFYTEVFIKFDHSYTIYSDEYNDFMEEKKTEWETITEQRAEKRYTDIVEEANKELEDARVELADKQAETNQELSDAFKEIEDGEIKLADGQEEIQKAKRTLADKQKEINNQEEMLNTSEQELILLEEAQAQMGQQQEARVQLEIGKARIAEGRTQLEEGKNQLLSAAEELSDQEKELQKAKEELEDGRKEYEEGKAEAETKIADAQIKIEDAQKEINEIEEPDYYVLDRNANVGYACFESDSNIVAGIANIFPIFFFLVAALVCITTMNRMVEEQRTQIGVLKALGYQETAIMSKFMFYSGSAAVMGCMLGFAAGTYVFPRVIWTGYGTIYNLVGLHYVFDWKLALISMVVSLLCSIGTTWISCRYELMEPAASLMRPKAPRAGKRVFLEYVPFIWKRLKFLHKVSVRNIVRYKRRFFMMIIGISGCTALVVTGFGVKDSITGIADQQYGKIQMYDGSIGLKNPSDKEEKTVLTDKLEEWSGEYTYASTSAMDVVYGNKTKAVNIVMLEEPEKAEEYISLHTLKGAPIKYPGKDEAVVSNKMAENLRLTIGTEIILRDDEMNEMKVKISGICENFVDNYLYLSPETYREQRKEDPEYKTIYFDFPEETDIHKASASMMKIDGVSSITVNQDMKDRFTSMMGSLDYIVLLVIGCAACLAFIVLYNLTNINITERFREIATIKVLGFYRNETASYVFRENMVLTAVGGGVGLIIGYFLHQFVMSQINVDMISFDVRIAPLSYLYSIILTFVFALIVDAIMSFKLDSINMAESLKSVD